LTDGIGAVVVAAVAVVAVGVVAGVAVVIVGGVAVGDGVCGLAGFGAPPGDCTGGFCAKVKTDTKTTKAITDTTCFIFEFLSFMVRIRMFWY